jgi:hypothetical protein
VTPRPGTYANNSYGVFYLNRQTDEPLGIRRRPIPPCARQTFKALLRDFTESDYKQSWAEFKKHIEGKKLDFASDKTCGVVQSVESDLAVKFPKAAAASVIVTIMMEKANAAGVDDSASARTRIYTRARASRGRRSASSERGTCWRLAPHAPVAERAITGPSRVTHVSRARVSRDSPHTVAARGSRRTLAAHGPAHRLWC